MSPHFSFKAERRRLAERERERERAELQSFLLRKMPGCVWDFSFRVNQGTKTSLTDGTVTMSYFDNVTRRALW